MSEVFTFQPTARTHSSVRSVPQERDPLSKMVIGTTRTDEDNQIRTFKVNPAERPENLYYTMTKQANYYYAYAEIVKLFRENSLARTLELRISSELARFQYVFEPKFAVKCKNPKCGHESLTLIDECPLCHGHEFITPDPAQQKEIIRPDGRSWLDCMNNKGMTMNDIVKLIAQNQIKFNQNYVLCNTRTTYSGETGEEIISVPEEFVVLDTLCVQQSFNDAGELGTEIAFTFEDRCKEISLRGTDKNDLEALAFAKENGYRLYNAAYKVGVNVGAAGKFYLYTKDEIYQDNWFEPSLTYGIPIWYSIMDDMLAWSAIEKHIYKKYDLGYTRSLVFIPGINDEDVDDLTKGITDALAINDNSLPIVCTPPTLNNTAPIQAQVIDLGTRDDQDTLAAKDDIRNRVCAFVGVPNLFVGDVEQSGGMNNESQQITIFDRYLTSFLNSIDKFLAWFQSWLPGITHWRLVADRPTKSEMNAKKRIDKMQEAQMMSQMGFLIQYKNGEFSYSERPYTQQQMIEQAKMQKEQMQQQQQMMMMQQMAGAQGGEEAGPEDNGILPGDGDGPPEKGSMRRDDHDVDGTKDEVDQTMREADL